VVANRERDLEPVEVAAVCVSLVDRPGQDAQALAVRRPAAEDAVDPPAGTDRIAVARLEVPPGYVPTCHLPRFSPAEAVTSSGSARPASRPAASRLEPSLVFTAAVKRAEARMRCWHPAISERATGAADAGAMPAPATISRQPAKSLYETRSPYSDDSSRSAARAASGVPPEICVAAMSARSCRTMIAVLERHSRAVSGAGGRTRTSPQ